MPWRHVKDCSKKWNDHMPSDDSEIVKAGLRVTKGCIFVPYNNHFVTHAVREGEARIVSYSDGMQWVMGNRMAWQLAIEDEHTEASMRTFRMSRDTDMILEK